MSIVIERLIVSVKGIFNKSLVDVLRDIIGFFGNIGDCLIVLMIIARVVFEGYRVLLWGKWFCSLFLSFF